MPILPFLASPLVGLALSVLEPPAITAKASELQVNFAFPPARIESVCGQDLFALERHVYVDSTAWICLRSDPATGHLNVIDWGYLDGFYGAVVRRPSAADRGIVFVVGQDFVRLDPVTLDRQVLGTLSPSVDAVNAATIIDVPPGTSNAVLINTPMDTQLHAYPGGQFLRSVIPWPQSAGWASEPAGNFLAAGTTLVAVPDNSNGVSFIVPSTGAVAKTFTNVPFGNWAIVGTRSSSGIDSLITTAGQYHELFTVDRFSPRSTLSKGSTSDGFANAATLVDWTAGEHDVVGMWTSALRVFNSTDGSVRYEETLSSGMFPTNPGLFAVDADGDGLQEVYWTDYDTLYSLPHGGASRLVQGPSDGFQVAGVFGTTLVTAEKSGEFGNQSLDIVFRDTHTLAVTARRSTAPAEIDARAVTAAVPGQVQPVLFMLTDTRLAAENVVDGAVLWELDNPQTSGNNWTALALPTGVCSNAYCARMLVASNAANSDTQGSFVWLLDSSSGQTLWQSTPEGGLGGGEYRAIALADINGDGVPDVIAARGNSPNGWLVEATDGQTFQSLWTKVLDNSAMPQAVGVSSKGSVRVALLLDDGSAELLDASDGSTLKSQPVVANVYANCCSIKYDAFANDEGIWVILGGASVQWLDAGFVNPVQSFDARGVSTEVSRGRGAMFAAGIEGVYRIQFPRDDIFIDDLEE